jgi:hypothetical protein
MLIKPSHTPQAAAGRKELRVFSASPPSLHQLATAGQLTHIARAIEAASMTAPRSLSRLTPRMALLALAGALLPMGSTAGRTSATSGEGYRLGEEIPVSCLNRTMSAVLRNLG